MKFIVMSDIHYIAKEMIIDDKKAMINSIVSESALMQAAGNDDIDTIIIHGDLTDRGDKPSHLELIEILRRIKKMGKKVYVTTATHDFCHHRAYTPKRKETGVKFASRPWENPYFDKENANYRSYIKKESQSLSDDEINQELVECFSPEELAEIYKEFGPDDAYSYEKTTASYCVDLDDKTRCLLLNDNFRNEEAMHDCSVGYTPACYKWIEKMVKEAKSEGKFIFACTHHPLLPPAPAYRIGAGNRDMRTPYSVHTLADIGINLVFTGHSHFADVGFALSEKGNHLYDITTPSVRNLPPRYRIVDLDGANGKVKLESISVNKPEGLDIKENTLEEYYRNELYDGYYSKMQNLKSPLNKILTEKTVGDLYFLCRCAKLSKEEYKKVKDIKFFDIVISAAMNMLTGDGAYTPDTPEYKVLMGFATTVDSIIDTQPFVDVKKKVLKGYSAREVVEPLCFNNYIPDNNAEFDFTVLPGKKTETPKFKSHAGAYLMAPLCILAIPLSALLPLVGIFALPVMTIKKKTGEKKHPTGPKYIY